MSPWDHTSYVNHCTDTLFLSLILGELGASFLKVVGFGLKGDTEAVLPLDKRFIRRLVNAIDRQTDSMVWTLAIQAHV